MPKEKNVVVHYASIKGNGKPICNQYSKTKDIWIAGVILCTCTKCRRILNKHHQGKTLKEMQ